MTQGLVLACPLLIPPADQPDHHQQDKPALCRGPEGGSDSALAREVPVRLSGRGTLGSGAACDPAAGSDETLARRCCRSEPRPPAGSPARLAAGEAEVVAHLQALNPYRHGGRNRHPGSAINRTLLGAVGGPRLVHTPSEPDRFPTVASGTSFAQVPGGLRQSCQWARVRSAASSSGWTGWRSRRTHGKPSRASRMPDRAPG